MKVVTCSEARSAPKTLLDRVRDDADVTVISRRDGADAVVMSLDHYQNIMETMHLLGTPANAAHLARSIAQHKAGKAVRRASRLSALASPSLCWATWPVIGHAELMKPTDWCMR